MYICILKLKAKRLKEASGNHFADLEQLLRAVQRCRALLAEHDLAFTTACVRARLDPSPQKRQAVLLPPLEQLLHVGKDADFPPCIKRSNAAHSFLCELVLIRRGRPAASAAALKLSDTALSCQTQRQWQEQVLQGQARLQQALMVTSPKP